jgi:hypothetical protein
MSTPLRQTLNLLTKRTEKKFDMRVRRIKKSQPIDIDTSDSIDVYCESESKTKSIIPKQIDSNGLIIGVDLDFEDIESADTYSFNDLNSIEDKISIVEMIDNN